MLVFRGKGRSVILVVVPTFLFLVLFCPTGVPGDQTCSCTGGCAPNQACESQTSCKKENVAYGKTTNITSIYINGDSRSTGPACVAVNGRTGHTLKYSDEPGTNCVHTASNDNNAFWSVDLGRNYTVKDIVIYSREREVDRLAGIWIYVDNNICKKFPRNTGSGFGLTYTAVCDSPLRGQIVNFTKKGPVGVPVDDKFINFCEVQIWVCKNGTFGQNCDRTCHCKDGALCDNYYGTCTSGCEDRYYGETCSATCGHCLDDAVCDDGNGHCPGGCRTGYQPPYCNITCPDKTYGDNCTETCGQCKDGAACNVFNGTCPTCQGNFSLPFCKVCLDGFYGDACRSCGHCFGGADCDKGNGHCPGVCQTGYEPPYCNTTCPDKTYGDNCTQTCGQCKDGAACDVFNGTCSTCQGNFSSPFCKDCKDGFYGDTCSGTCGHCKDAAAVCDKANGHCPTECETGYVAPLCQDTCPDKTYGDNCAETCGQCKDGAACNVFNGTCPTCQGNFSHPFCKSCLGGFYGDTCSEACGHCKDNDVCDASKGHCLNGCKTGYAAPLCQDTCPDKTYGDNCSKTCGQCKDGAACNVFNGTCPTCQGNFSPPFCKGCLDGFYGDTCSETCGQCKGDAVCDRSNGHCPQACEAGYVTPLCKSTCPGGTYGDNCVGTCGRCKGGAACNVTHGACLMCEGEFSLPLCTEKLQAAFPTGPVAGGVVGGVVLVVAVAVVGILLFRRRRRKQKDPPDTPLGNSQSENDTDLSERPLTFLPIVDKGAHTPSKPSTKTSTKSSTKPISHVKPIKQTAGTDSRNGGANAQRQQETGIYANDPNASTSSPPAPPPAAPARPAPPASRATPKPEDAEMETPFVDAVDESDEALYGNVGNVYSALKSFKHELDAVQNYLVARLASEGLRAEFQTISKIDKEEAVQVSGMKVNAKKNRYAGIVPYDSNRVVLTDDFKEGLSTDYINASYISGYNKECKYIAAQGPKDVTAGDFWRMVWQEKVTHIVMLTNLQEQGRAKCDLYWSNDDGATTTVFSPVTVNITKEERRDHFFTRTLTITRDGSKERREVTQYHYVSWPDHGVPSTVSLARFWRHVTNRARGSQAPLLVHCSAGVGRTGTFIGLDLGMEIAVNEGRIDVLDLVKRLRQERTLMVQAMDQYVCLYEVLLEAYTARDSCLPLDEFDVTFPQPITDSCGNERIDKEFKAVLEMKPLFSQWRHLQATREENMNKNRDPSVLPVDDHLVYLMQHEAGRNQYINAVFMPTFRDPRGSILTQLPLPSTLVDFWRMAYGNDITTIVSLCTPDEKEEVTPSCQYWPLSNREPVQSGAYTVTLQSRQTVLQCLTSYNLTLVKSGNDDNQRSIQLLHYVGWDGETGGESADMLQLIDSLAQVLGKEERPKLVIQCRDGVSKSGLFSALYDVINSMMYDRELDVYLAVRHVQNVAPSAVTSLTQYRYIYHIAQQRYREMSIYANN